MKRNLSIATGFVLSSLLFVGTVNSQTPDVSQSGGVTIRNGGGVRGIVKPGDAGCVTIESALGGSITLDDSIVKQTTTLRKEQLDYRRSAPLQKDDPESHLKIARWANGKSLSGVADAHYERVIELDPDNEEARKALHFTKSGGEWVSNKEKMEKSGLVRVNGRSVSRQEAELIRRAQETQEAARYWKKEIQTLYSGAMQGGQRYREALRSVRNPLALSTIGKLFQKEKNPEGRVLLAQAMGSIGTPTALSELGRIALNDPDVEVRAAAVEGIYRKKTAAAEAIEYFRRGLQSDDPVVINNAAYALGRLQASAAIPDLINALVTAHKRQVAVGSEQTGATFDGSGRLSSFSPGGGARMKTVTEYSQNEAVHQALVQIVGMTYAASVDYGYDVDAWIHWRRSVDQLANFYPRRDR